MSVFNVVFRVLDKLGTSFIEPRREDGHGSDRLTPSFVDSQDIYTTGQTLADQTANGSALSFSFTSPVNLVYILVKSSTGTAVARVDPFGGTPTNTQGIPADDGIPLALPVLTSIVKVFATTGSTVSVWGFKY